MNALKRILCTLLAIVIMMSFATVAFAEQDSQKEYKILLSSSIDGTNSLDTTFKFQVACTLMDETETDKEVVDTKFVEYNTKTESRCEYVLNNEHIKNGGYIYQFKVVETSNDTAVCDSKVVTIYLLKDIVKVFDSSKEGEEVLDLDADFPYNVTFDCKTGIPVSVKFTNNLLTKFYDGTDAFTLLPENYTLSGVKKDHDVSLSVGSAKFDAVDANKATKVMMEEVSLTGADADKYVLKSTTLECDGEIKPRPITVTADDKVMTKGSAEPELTYTLSEPLIEGNVFVGNLVRQQGTDVGEYAITRGTLLLNDNYDITFVEGKLTVSNFLESTVRDSGSNISVTGFFSSDSKLTVKNLPVADNTYKMLAAGASWGDIISAYTLSLGGASFDGTVNITIPVPSEFNGMELTVYQALSSGGIACYKLNVVDGTITVITDEISSYLIVGPKTNNNENKTSVWGVIFKIVLIVLLVLALLILLAAAFFFGMIFFNKTDELKKMIKTLKRLFKKNK